MSEHTLTTLILDPEDVAKIIIAFVALHGIVPKHRSEILAALVHLFPPNQDHRQTPYRQTRSQNTRQRYPAEEGLNYAITQRWRNGSLIGDRYRPQCNGKSDRSK
jgi:hypothetical protein